MKLLPVTAMVFVRATRGTICRKFDHDRSLFSRSLESWELDSGNHSQMAEFFRLVNYYNLPRFANVENCCLNFRHRGMQYPSTWRNLSNISKYQQDLVGGCQFHGLSFISIFG